MLFRVHVRFFCYIVFGIFIASCDGRDKRRISVDGARSIDIGDIDTEHDYAFSDYFEIVDITSLQSDTNSLIAETSKIFEIDSCFFILDKKFTSLKVFNKSGKFKYSIGSIGEGEGQYTRLNDAFIRNGGDQICLYSNKGRGIYQYNKDGGFIRKVPVPFFAYYAATLPDSSLYFYSNYNPDDVNRSNNVIAVDRNGKLNGFFEPFANPETPAFDFSGYITSFNSTVLYSRAFGDSVYAFDSEKKMKLKYVVSPLKTIQNINSSKLNIGQILSELQESEYIHSRFLETGNLFTFGVKKRNLDTQVYYIKDKDIAISGKNFQKYSIINYLNAPCGSSGEHLIASVNLDKVSSDKEGRFLDYLKGENAALYNLLRKNDGSLNSVIVKFRLKQNQ